jgi:hypothetical protein
MLRELQAFILTALLATTLQDCGQFLIPVEYNISS